jgi:phosphoribosylglycinamide formyltransferase 2
MTKVLLLGSGELGKEVAIELMRLGVYVVAADRYKNAPAAQIAHESLVFEMTDENALREVIEQVRPDIIVPEIEAIATNVLKEFTNESHPYKCQIVPSANAVDLTMNREGIRRLVAEDLGIATSEYCFASSFSELEDAVKQIGLPVVIKPVQSSSGKGQSTIQDMSELKNAWNYAQTDSRGKSDKVIVEGFVDFDYEITLLTVRAKNGVTFLDPIWHTQVDGDYRTSWQLGTAKSVERADIDEQS